MTPNHDYVSIYEVQKALAEGKMTVTTLVHHYLKSIETQNPGLNAVTVLNGHALEDAERLDNGAETSDQALNPKDRGPLFGIPIVVKDQIETAGIPTAFGSEACIGYIPEKDATIVQRLKDAGAVLLGKSTMPDWAASWFSTSSLSSTTKNPFDLSRDPGGSSSGSGAAVAAGMALAAIGGDTGGSIRLPASFCGLTGVRVTPGRISRDGMSALVQNQDTPGPMTKSVEDAARILDVVVGFDGQDDFTSVNVISPLRKSKTPFQDAIKDASLEGKRIGVLRQAFGEDKGILSILDRSLAAIKVAGAEVVDVEVPDLEYYKTASSAYVCRSKADINAFCASRKELAHLKLEDLHAKGRYHKALDLIDAVVKGPTDIFKNPHYTEAMLVQAKFQRIVASLYAKHELHAIVYPTCQVLPPKTEDILNATWTCLDFPTNTIIGSQLLFPAVSLPAGKTKDLGRDQEGPELPVGLEILGLPLREESLLAVAAAVEAAFKTK